MEGGEFGGRTSEWNEGAFKSARLHEIQSAINTFRLDPLAITDGKFNYYWLVQSIDNLYGEGYSKYSDKEREGVDKVRDVVLFAINYSPPTKVIRKQGMSNTQNGFHVDDEKYLMMMRAILLFERKVKDYNDKHGLTTSNAPEEGGWD